MKAAFFDLDGTLLRENSANLWIRHEHRHGRVRWRDIFSAAWRLGGYKLGFLDMESALRAALRTLRGVEEELIRERTQQWWETDVRRHIARGAQGALAKHRARGEKLVLLTSSSIYASEMAVQEFGLDAALCQRYEVRDARFTGDFLRPICYGAGKVEVAEQWAREHGVDVTASAFYTDSSTDLPMLEKVAEPYAVNPDPRLRVIAKRRGWPILDWS